MLPSEKFGFIGPFAWLVDQPMPVIVGVCLLITPGLPMIIAPLLESRWLPLRRALQFGAFFPGDVFLSLGVAFLLWAGRFLPAKEAWYQSPWFHLVVAVGAFVVAGLLTLMELKAPESAAYAWPVRTRKSPTKLYHNFALYGGYGYLGVTALISCAAGGLVWTSLFGITVAGPWIYFLMTDNKAPEEIRTDRLRFAHIADWKPIWANGWRVRTVEQLRAAGA